MIKLEEGKHPKNKPTQASQEQATCFEDRLNFKELEVILGRRKSPFDVRIY